MNKLLQLLLICSMICMATARQLQDFGDFDIDTSDFGSAYDYSSSLSASDINSISTSSAKAAVGMGVTLIILIIVGPIIALICISICICYCCKCCCFTPKQAPQVVMQAAPGQPQMMAPK